MPTKVHKFRLCDEMYSELSPLALGLGQYSRATTHADVVASQIPQASSVMTHAGTVLVVVMLKGRGYLPPQDNYHMSALSPQMDQSMARRWTRSASKPSTFLLLGWIQFDMTIQPMKMEIDSEECFWQVAGPFNNP